MKNPLVDVKPFVFRGDVIGKVFTFDLGNYLNYGVIEITTDLSGDIVDYSGCGYNTANTLIRCVHLTD
jgi:hypothetical protein